MIPPLPRKASAARCAANLRPPLCLVALAVYLMAPMLRTGYLSDDSVTSTTPGMLVYTGWSLWGRIFDTIRFSMREGRFYPLHWVAFSGVFTLIQDVFAYKVYILSLVVVDVLIFYALARRLFADARSGFVAASVALMLMQFRAYHDPILSFFGLLQVVAALNFLAILMILRGLDGGCRAWLRLGAALYLTSMLLYEASYPFVVLFAAVIGLRVRGWRARLAASRPFLLAAGFCVGTSLLLRMWSRGDSGTPNHYPMNLAPLEVTSAVLRQACGALPLSYFLIDPAGLFGRFKGLAATPMMILQPDVLAVLVLSATLSFVALARMAKAGPCLQAGRGEGRLLGVVGLSMASLPALMIALTTRYQREISPGTPYVPIYLQYFGVALLLAALMRKVVRRFPAGWAATGSSLALAATLGCATAVTYRANVATVASLVSPPGAPDFNPSAYAMAGAWHHDRVNLEAAMRAGLLDPVPAHARLFPSRSLGMPFEGVFFYAMHAGRVFEVLAPERAATAPPTSAPAFAVSGTALGESAGYAFLARADGGPELRLFVRMPRLIAGGLPPRFLVSGCVAGTTDAASYVKPLRDLPILRSGPDWAIFCLDSESGRVRPESLELVLKASEVSWVLATHNARTGRSPSASVAQSSHRTPEAERR